MTVNREYLRELIIQSNAIEGIDDPAEITQSLSAWDYLFKNKTNLNHHVVQQVQKRITLNQPLRSDQKGYYRDQSQTNVRVGSYRPPDFGEVPLRMQTWLEMYPMRTAWESHVDFERIHPFVDGNGRTGRMLMWWIEIKLFDREPTMIRYTDRWSYYAQLSEHNPDYRPVDI